MGCDIHEYVEVRDAEGRWRVVGKREQDPEFPEEFNFTGCPIQLGRNYDLFAILADVRNGTGFAGVDTGDGFVPIAEPRGLPDDCDEATRAESSAWDSDGHSHSWVTVAELLAYDWTRETVHRGWVNGPEFAEWERFDRGDGEPPKNYSGGVMGQNVKHVPEAELSTAIKRIREFETAKTPDQWHGPDGIHARVEKRIAEELGSTFAQVQWRTPYYKSVRNFLSDAIPVLLRLGKPEDVRLVFWFDN